MPKFKIQKIKNSKIIISDNDINHIIKSLRKKDGDYIFCLNDDFEYKCVIKKDPFELEIVDKKELKKDLKDIHIYMGVIEKQNLELIVKKLNELNCKKMTPVYFERSQNNIKINYDRLKKIVFESSKQCHRNIDLVIEKEIFFNEMIENIQNNNLNIFAYQHSKNYSFNEKNINLNEKINLIIGPEGGLTEKEIEILSKISYTINLSSTILKSETAAIFLASIVMYEIRKNKNEKR